MNRTYISVANEIEAIHCYPDAPDEVAFLRNPHRHLFKIQTEIEVFSDDRELEFIMVKNNLEKKLNTYGGDLGTMSCEMLGLRIQAYIKNTYPVPENVIESCMKQLGYSCDRKVNVSVFEDGENGALIREVF